MPLRARLHRVPLVAIAVLALGAPVVAAGCLLTSEFDDIVGTRPVDAGPDEPIVEEDAEAGGPLVVDCTKDTHLLCTNFDQGGLTQNGWIVDETGQGKATLDGALAVSRPASFRSTLPVTTTATNVGAILRQNPRVGKFTALRYGFDMRIAQCSAATSSITLSAVQTSGATAFGIVLVNNEWTFAQLLLDQGGLFKPQRLARPLPLDRWFRIDARIEISATVAKVVVVLDGEIVLDGSYDPRTPAETLLLNVGANATGPIDRCDVNYDNVTLDKE